jgi:hypothetical protein
MPSMSVETYLNKLKAELPRHFAPGARTNWSRIVTRSSTH